MVRDGRWRVVWRHHGGICVGDEALRAELMGLSFERWMMPAPSARALSVPDPARQSTGAAHDLRRALMFSRNCPSLVPHPHLAHAHGRGWLWA